MLDALVTINRVGQESESTALASNDQAVQQLFDDEESLTVDLNFDEIVAQVAGARF